jgi:nucleotide-binding universal stress UspA family protein
LHWFNWDAGLWQFGRLPNLIYDNVPPLFRRHGIFELRRTAMYHRILIATDGSELANKGVAHGIGLAKDLKIPVCVVTVTEAWSAFELARVSRMGNSNPITRYEEMAAAAANNILGKAEQLAKTQGVECELVHIQDQHPADGIIATAKEKGCDLIVMASHGRRGINRLLLGSQANEVLTHSKVPALIVR